MASRVGLGAVARDVDPVALRVPGAHGLDGVRVGLGVLDVLVGVGLGDQLLRAGPARGGRCPSPSAPRRAAGCRSAAAPGRPAGPSSGGGSSRCPARSAAWLCTVRAPCRRSAPRRRCRPRPGRPATPATTTAPQPRRTGGRSTGGLTCARSTIDGRSVNYVDYGGPGEAGLEPVVFVHGLGGCWQNWLENIPRVAAEGRRAIGIDLPGFGFSEMPAEEISISGYGRTVNALCDQLDIGEAVFVGNSMGGFISAEVGDPVPRPRGADRARLGRGRHDLGPEQRSDTRRRACRGGGGHAHGRSVARRWCGGGTCAMPSTTRSSGTRRGSGTSCCTRSRAGRGGPGSWTRCGRSCTTTSATASRRSAARR